MYTIYNETKRPLKLSTSTVDGTTMFQISIGDDADHFTDKYTITTIANEALAGVMTSFCENCHDVVSKTSRFHFREPNKQVIVYDDKTCEVKTFDKATAVEDNSLRKMSHNCLIFVLNKDSKVKAFPNTIHGHIPAKEITVENLGVVIKVFFVRMNNWANIRSDKPVYIYVDGVDGKKQVRLGYVKIGKNKEHTSNSLFEEDFVGEEFPEAPARKPFNKFQPKTQNYHRENTERFVSDNDHKPTMMNNNDAYRPKPDRRRNFNNFDNTNNNFHKYEDYNDNMRGGGRKRGNPHRNKKRRRGHEE